jgi:signal transduction histidine kinase/CheY-like chemotaxis protein
MLAFWSGGSYEQCLEYALEGTPCEYVYRGEITSYARNVGDVFPVDRAWFEQLGIKSYLGIPVKDETGTVRGHLAVMDTRERDWADADVDILRLFSIRSAAELERLRYQGELEGANSALRTANERLEGEIAQRAAMEVELAAAKNMAESANRAKSAFISQMSHELRTPLNGILGYAQLLKREYSGSGEKLAGGLGIIERSGEHLLKLVNDLLDLAKIEAGKLELTRDRVDLHELVEHVANLARVRAAIAGLALHVEMDAKIPMDVVTDERVVRQILLNLLGNAVKFTEPGGRITLRALGEPIDGGRRRVRFAVEDSGIGIEAGQLARIFEPFHRITSTERVVEGTGLGLTITQRLVAALDGRLSVTSHRGAGSNFVVEIDFELAPALQPAVNSAEEIQGYAGDTRIVLVADDDQDNRSLVSQLLESVGFLVQSVSNGFEAMQRVRSIRPDLIITDLVMPVMDGMELIKSLRADETLNRLPVIAMSASASDYTREEALQAGCSEFLSKPLKLTSVLEVVGGQLHLQWRYRASAAVDAGEASAEPYQLEPGLAGELQHLAMQGDIPPVPPPLPVFGAAFT